MLGFRFRFPKIHVLVHVLLVAIAGCISQSKNLKVNKGKHTVTLRFQLREMCVRLNLTCMILIVTFHAGQTRTGGGGLLWLVGSI